MTKFFCAYPGYPALISQSFSAAAAAMGIGAPVLQLWQENNICGRALTDPIFENIDTSDAVIIDVTYPNFNVFFEAGYAIGRGKRIFPVKHAGIRAQEISEIGIFDSIGYNTYENSSQLARLIQAQGDLSPLSLDFKANAKSPVYLVEFSTKIEYFTILTSRIKKARFKYRSFNPQEHVRLSAFDAIKSVSSSFGVVVPLVSSHFTGFETHNLRCAFVAGISLALDKPTLLIQEFGGPIPSDILDLVKIFKHPDSLGDFIADFAPQVVEAMQAEAPAVASNKTKLSQLNIGDPMAENEMSSLSEYYLLTDQFQRTERGEVNLVVGRKGTGKTALFVQLRNNIRRKINNVVVDLKPEGYQLIRFKEDVLTFLSEGSCQHLLTGIWEYVLLLEVCYKVLEKDKDKHIRSQELHAKYKELESLYIQDGAFNEGDFSERLLRLSDNIRFDFRRDYKDAADIRLSSNQITNLLYKHDISKLRSSLTQYLKLKGEVWILFDNLDKGWPSQGIAAEDITILRCLIDAAKKIQRELKRSDVKSFNVVFVRDDIYDNLIRRSSDFGKELQASLDWSDRTLLALLIHRRMGNENNDFLSVWRSYFSSHIFGEETFDYIIDRSLMRPRNLIKIVSYCKSYAINRQETKISEADIADALAIYSNDILLEADHELSDLAPYAKGMLYQFIGEQSSFGSQRLEELVSQHVTYDVEKKNNIINFLLYFGFLGIKVNAADVNYIYDYFYNMDLLSSWIMKLGANVEYVLNPAFWPALGIEKK